MNRKSCKIKNKVIKVAESRRHKLTERLLRESEIALKNLVDNMSSAVAVYEAKNNGKDFIIKNFNRAAEKIEQVKRGEIIGKSVLKVFPGVKDFGIFKVFQQVWKTGKPEHFPIALYKDKRISGWKENYVYRLPNKDIVAIYDDVTNQKIAEEKLQQSEEKFYKAFQISPYAIAITRAKDGSFIDVNDGFISTMGFTRKEALSGSSIGLKIWVNEADRHEMVSDLRAGRPVINREYQFRTKNGEILTGLFSAQTIQLSQGQCVLSNMIDITERNRIEKALEESEGFNRRIVETANEGIWVMDKNCKTTYVNKKMAEISGFSIKEILGKRVTDFLLPEYLASHREEVQKRKKGKPGNYERCFKRKDGAKIFVSISSVPILDKDGKFVGSFGTVQDITERKKSEQLVNDIKTRDEAILSSIGDAVFAIDRNGKILLFNKVAEELTGIRTKEAIGRHYGKTIAFIREKDGKPSDDFIAEAMQNNRITEMGNNIILVRKNGSMMPVADSAAPIRDCKGNVIGCVVAFRDATKEREIDRSKTEFVSLVSHQLRTPTTSINWYSEMLLDEEVGTLNEKQKEYLKEIHHGNQRMIDLVNALLSVSRIELGTFVIQSKPIDIPMIADDVLTELQTEIENKGLIVEKKYRKNISAIKSDKKLIRIIFQNLLSNAVSYTPPKGKISIKIKKTGINIHIEVKDNGCGIPQSAQSKVYTKFFRAANASAVKPDGTGLGLYITKSIVKTLGGTISFKSKEGSGTIFYVNIPSRKTAQKDQIKKTE